MSRFSPSVAPEYYGGNPGAAIAQAIVEEHQRRRQQKLDDAYLQSVADRHAMEPLEEALYRAQLYEHGVVPTGSHVADAIEGPRAPAPAAPAPPSTDGFGADVLGTPRQGPSGADLVSGRAKFGDGAFLHPVGIASPGAFNPATGDFNGPETVPMGTGFELDPRLTPTGRAQAIRDRAVASLRGVFTKRGLDPSMVQPEVDLGLTSVLSSQLDDPLAREKALLDLRFPYDSALVRLRNSTTPAATTREDTRLNAAIDDARQELQRVTAERSQMDKDGRMILGKGATPADSAQAATLDQRAARLQAHLDSLTAARDRPLLGVFGQQSAGSGARTPDDWVREVRRDHPSWGPEQVAAEARRRAGASRR